MKSSHEFARGLDDLFDGLQIHIKENAIRNTAKKTKSDPARLHAITAYLRDEDYNLITEPTDNQCALQFDD